MTRVAIPADAWVLVGDGEKALLFCNVGDEEYPNLKTIGVIEQDNPPTREQGSGQPGRFNDLSGPHKSAAEQTDWHRLGKERFARDIAERLYRSAHRNEFDKLIIVAPPRTLGTLREELHEEVIKRVIAEIDKTLTNRPPHEIEKLITA